MKTVTSFSDVFANDHQSF